MVAANGDESQLTQSEDLASAKFSATPPENSRAQSSRFRLLRGEVTIPEDLAPECHVLHYDMQVNDSSVDSGFFGIRQLTLVGCD